MVTKANMVKLKLVTAVVLSLSIWNQVGYGPKYFLTVNKKGRMKRTSNRI